MKHIYLLLVSTMIVGCSSQPLVVENVKIENETRLGELHATQRKEIISLNKSDAASALEVTPLRAPAGMSGLRIKAPDNLFVSATPDNARWTIRLGAMSAPMARALRWSRICSRCR